MHFTPPNAAVLGGGIGGLMTAHELAKAGVNVTVIEASPRVGGHIFTERNVTEDGLYVERGAELVDSTNLALLKKLKELRLGVVDSSLSTAGDFFHSNGQVRSEDEFFEAYKPLAVELKKLQSQLRTPDGQYTEFARELDKVSMDELLDRYVDQGVVESWVPTMLKQAYTGEIGRDSSMLSSVAFLDCVGADIERGLELYGDSDEAYRIENGSESVIDALKAELTSMGVHFSMSEKVTGLEAAPDGKGMMVHSLRDGVIEKHNSYDYVVSALPLPALRTVKGIENLGLSEEQLAAVHETQYATITKFTLETKGKPWLDLRAANGSGGNGAIYTDRSPIQTIWVSNEGQPADKPHDLNANGLVTFYIGGSDGQTPAPELVAKAKEEYAAIMGKPASEVFTDRAPVLSDWSQENHGCFAAAGPGQYTRLTSFREQSSPCFSMVGEFVPVPTERGSSVGFMNNAADSAEREAQRALDILVQRTLDVSKERPMAQLAQPTMEELARMANESSMNYLKSEPAIVGRHTASIQQQRDLRQNTTLTPVTTR